jgi:hypothetical protein
MKQIFTSFIFLVIASVSFGNPVIKATKNNGKWSNNNDWNLNRAPQDNDTIVIPAGMIFVLDLNANLNNVNVIVFGTLDLQNGKLKLDNSSRVVAGFGGRISGGGNNDQIQIGGTFKFKGTDPDVIGYAYADNTTGNGFAYMLLLSVEFSSFYVNKSGNDVQLTWSTSKEINNSHFEIEKSVDGKNWNKIGIVNGAVNSNLANKYGYTDVNVSNASLYYRIRQVDIDGRSTYSAMKIIRTDLMRLTNIYSSSKQSVSIDFNKAMTDNILVRVLNMNGQLISQKNFQQPTSKITVTLDKTITGAHLVQVTNSKGWFETKKIIL